VPAPAATQLIRVAPDRPDWTYAPGEPVAFHITVALDPHPPAAGVAIKYRSLPAPRCSKAPKNPPPSPRPASTLPAATLPAPGFLRCIVTATIDGKAQRGLATAGFTPGEIRVTQTEPTDFDASWSEQKAALGQGPRRSRTHTRPRTLQRQSRGLLRQPPKRRRLAGRQPHSRRARHPARPRSVSRAPHGALAPALRPYKGLIALAEKGLITLQIGIDGIPVNLPPAVDDTSGRGALADYNRFNLDDRRALLLPPRSIPAASAPTTTSPPTRNGTAKTLSSWAAAQGGQLSIVTAALDARVTALAADYPAYSDVTGYLHGRAGGWPGPRNPGADGVPLETRRQPPPTRHHGLRTTPSTSPAA